MLYWTGLDLCRLDLATGSSLSIPELIEPTYMSDVVCLCMCFQKSGLNTASWILTGLSVEKVVLSMYESARIMSSVLNILKQLKCNWSLMAEGLHTTYKKLGLIVLKYA